jgi:hypothetical protein
MKMRHVKDKQRTGHRKRANSPISAKALLSSGNTLFFHASCVKTFCICSSLSGSRTPRQSIREKARRPAQKFNTQRFEIRDCPLSLLHSWRFWHSCRALPIRRPPITPHAATANIRPPRLVAASSVITGRRRAVCLARSGNNFAGAKIKKERSNDRHFPHRRLLHSSDSHACHAIRDVVMRTRRMVDAVAAPRAVRRSKPHNCATNRL